MSLKKQNNAPCVQRVSEPPVLCRPRKKQWLTVREMTVFSMLGALMFCSKLLLEWAPNIHLLALFIIAFTRVYRAKALVPLYVFVLLTGVYGGFNFWWVPYLYIWLPLFGAAMLLPRRMPKRIAFFVYVALGATHGILYGVLYAPAQALFFGLSFTETLVWIASGTVFDILHAAGNAAACTLTIPLISTLLRLERRTARSAQA